MLGRSKRPLCPNLSHLGAQLVLRLVCLFAEHNQPGAKLIGFCNSLMREADAHLAVSSGVHHDLRFLVGFLSAAGSFTGRPITGLSWVEARLTLARNSVSGLEGLDRSTKLSDWWTAVRNLGAPGLGANKCPALLLVPHWCTSLPGDNDIVVLNVRYSTN